MKGAILCVDDEEFVLQALNQDLKKHFDEEFIIELAQSATDGFEILDELVEDEIKVVVIISDWFMPGMKGDQFLIEAHKKFPKVVKIMLTGQSNDQAIENAKNNANLKQIFSKPWDGNKLAKTIKDELGISDE